MSNSLSFTINCLGRYCLLKPCFSGLIQFPDLALLMQLDQGATTIPQVIHWNLKSHKFFQYAGPFDPHFQAIANHISSEECILLVSYYGSLCLNGCDGVACQLFQKDLLQHYCGKFIEHNYLPILLISLSCYCVR